MAGDESKIVGTISILLAVFNGVVLIVSVGASLTIRQGFAGLFLDFEAPLPWMTVVLLSTPLIVWAVVMVFLLVVLVVKEFITRKWIPLCLNLLFIGLAIVYWIFFCISVVLPLVRIHEQLAS